MYDIVCQERSRKSWAETYGGLRGRSMLTSPQYFWEIGNTLYHKKCPHPTFHLLCIVNVHIIYLSLILLLLHFRSKVRSAFLKGLKEVIKIFGRQKLKFWSKKVIENFPRELENLIFWSPQTQGGERREKES